MKIANPYLVPKVKSLRGSPCIPGDKSISHRALIFSALADGRSEFTNLLRSEDVESTARCLKQLGAEIVQEVQGNEIYYFVDGRKTFKDKNLRLTLDCGNSGTSMRVLMGLLAGNDGYFTLVGDQSLSKRPMKRVSDPLKLMGASIELAHDNFAPLRIEGQKLKAMNYEMSIASAQVRTALNLAGLYAEGETTLFGNLGGRDHTERLLPFFGCQFNRESHCLRFMGKQKLHPQKFAIPSRPSTAAFWIAAASILENSYLELKNVSLNPTRLGFIRAMEKMGAKLDIELINSGAEPYGNISVSSNSLNGVIIDKNEIPDLIDEIPILALVATQAFGVTEVRGAEELRVKESDRLDAIVTNLRAMGVDLEVFTDGFRIVGPQKLHGANLDSFHDHRVAMTFTIAGLLAQGETKILHPECVSISYPEFFETLKSLS